MTATTNRPHDASHVWTKMANGLVRCAYMGCQKRPLPADVERLEAELATAARMRIELVQGRREGLPGHDA
jgi:hypothetical protein